MLTVTDSRRYQELLAAIVRGFNESDLTGTELQAIAQRAAQGETVDRAIGSLNLNGRASAQLATLFTPKAASSK
jgi:hypothetical protein